MRDSLYTSQTDILRVLVTLPNVLEVVVKSLRERFPRTGSSASKVQGEYTRVANKLLDAPPYVSLWRASMCINHCARRRVCACLMHKSVDLLGRVPSAQGRVNPWGKSRIIDDGEVRQTT